MEICVASLTLSNHSHAGKSYSLSLALPNIKGLFWSSTHIKTSSIGCKASKCFLLNETLYMKLLLNKDKRHWKYPCHSSQVCYILPLRSGERLEEKTRLARQKHYLPQASVLVVNGTFFLYRELLTSPSCWVFITPQAPAQHVKIRGFAIPDNYNTTH